MKEESKGNESKGKIRKRVNSKVRGKGKGIGTHCSFA